MKFLQFDKIEKEENEEENNIENENNEQDEENNINISSKNNNSINIISLIEENFISIKNDLELILTKVEFNDINEIREQNDNLIDYITKLNDIINSIFDIFPRGEKLLTDKISKIRKIDTIKKTREQKQKRILDI